MINRRSVWKKLKQEGVLDSTDPKVKEFVKYMRDNPKKCWADLVPVFRQDYYSTFDTFAPLLVSMKDPVVNTQLLKNLDPNDSKELDILSSIADTSDPNQDPLTFKRLAKLNSTKINKRLVTKTLPEGIKSLLPQALETGTQTTAKKVTGATAKTAKKTTAKKTTTKKAAAKKTTVKKGVAKKKTLKKT